MVYVDVSRREFEFKIHNWVFLKVSPIKGVMRFRKKGKINPRYISLYQILRRVRNVAYKFKLLMSLASVHPVFYMSMLRKCVVNPTLVVPIKDICVKDSISYEKVPIEILYRQVWKLRAKEIALIKVLWRNHKEEEAT